MAARSFLYGGGGGGGGGGSVLLTNKRVHCSSSSSSSKNLDSFFISESSPSFLGSRSMFSFEDRGNGSGRPFFQTYDQEDNGDDEYDEYFHQPEKKRRLTADQVRFLEKCFETENKLEPDRKVQLAKDLGLQPRQVAIWFQNRRARWKNKQLEKDYDVLQDSYNQLKANYENLLKEKEKLKSEVQDLSQKLLNGTSDSSSTKSHSEPRDEEQAADYAYDENVSGNLNLGYEGGDNVGVKSIVFDSENLLECVDSSYVFEHEQSDGGSVDEEDNFSKMFLPGYMSPKIENEPHPDPNSVDSYYLGLPGDDQSFGFWSY